MYLGGWLLELSLRMKCLFDSVVIDSVFFVICSGWCSGSMIVLLVSVIWWVCDVSVLSSIYGLRWLIGFG